MCAKFELITEFENLPCILKHDYPFGLDTRYHSQNLIRPTDPVLVIKNEGKLKLLLCHGVLFHLGLKTHLIKERPRPFNARSETVEEKNYLLELET